MEEMNEADEQALFDALHDVSTQRCFSKAMFGLDYGGTKYRVNAVVKLARIGTV